nr:hypothetical protein HmN_000868700 [Hymenolepis microstoma]
MGKHVHNWTPCLRGLHVLFLRFQHFVTASTTSLAGSDGVRAAVQVNSLDGILISPKLEPPNIYYRMPMLPNENKTSFKAAKNMKD